MVAHIADVKGDKDIDLFISLYKCNNCNFIIQDVIHVLDSIANNLFFFLLFFLLFWLNKSVCFVFASEQIVSLYLAIDVNASQHAIKI